MRVTANVRKQFLAPILITISGVLFTTLRLTEAVSSTNLKRDLICTIFHGETAKSFTWDGNETHSIDVVLLTSSSRPFIECSLRNNASVATKLETHITNSSNGEGFAKRQLNVSVWKASKPPQFYVNFSMPNGEDGTKWNTTIWVVASGNRQLLFQGTVVQVGNLPSYSNSSLNHTNITSVFQNASWEFHNHYCTHGVVLLVPQNRSELKYGFPLGIAYGFNQLTIMKWENITTGGVFNGPFKVDIYNNFLFMFNASHMYMMHGGNLSAVTFSFDVQEIISLSHLQSCNFPQHVKWYEMVVFVRLRNSSLAMALRNQTHSPWYHYIFPLWLSPATYISGEIDYDRNTMVIAVNIGQPQKTMVVGFIARLGNTSLEVDLWPTQVGKLLNLPKMKIIQAIPAVVIHDQKEIWLSTDAGRYFKRIFLADNGTNIRAVEYFPSKNATIFIMTSRYIVMYGTSVFKKLYLQRNHECVKRNPIIVTSRSGPRLLVTCGNEVLQVTKKSHIIELVQDGLIVPSAPAHLLNELEMRLDINYYPSMRYFEQSFLDICNIQYFPYVFFCNSKLHGSQSIIASLKGKIQKSTNCSFEFRRRTSSFYYITASNFQNGSCGFWTAKQIGQTLITLDSYASCWIYWVLNGTTAIANCSKQDTIGTMRRVSYPFVSLIDSRGDESCENRTLRLVATNQTGLYVVQMNGTLVNVGVVDAYLRVFDSIGKLINIGRTNYVQFLGNANITLNEFPYTCLIRKISSQQNNDQGPGSFICRFNIAISGLEQMRTFGHRLVNGSSLSSEHYVLDANDRVQFNITLTVKDGLSFLNDIPPITVQPIEPFYIALQSNSNMTSTQNHIRVLIVQKPDIGATSALAIYTMTQPLTCEGSHRKLEFHGACPPGKSLHFDYPLTFTNHQWLYGNPVDKEGSVRIVTLPYNYQPPSYLGKAIPLTSNIYNADPSMPMYRSTYKKSRDAAKFKQCKRKASRSQCGCTLNLTFSALPAYTDCIQRAYRIFSLETLRPRISVRDARGVKKPLPFPYCISELNNRSDYTLQNMVNASCLSIQRNSTLKFKGSGLFHFKVTANQPHFTFCNLQTYFLVYVESTKLPYPGQELVMVMTAFVLGFVILCTFWVYFYLK